MKKRNLPSSNSISRSDVGSDIGWRNRTFSRRSVSSGNLNPFKNHDPRSSVYKENNFNSNRNGIQNFRNERVNLEPSNHSLTPKKREIKEFRYPSPPRKPILKSIYFSPSLNVDSSSSTVHKPPVVRKLNLITQDSETIPSPASKDKFQEEDHFNFTQSDEEFTDSVLEELEKFEDSRTPRILPSPDTEIEKLRKIKMKRDNINININSKSTKIENNETLKRIIELNKPSVESILRYFGQNVFENAIAKYKSSVFRFEIFDEHKNHQKYLILTSKCWEFDFLRNSRNSKFGNNGIVFDQRTKFSGSRILENSCSCEKLKCIHCCSSITSYFYSNENSNRDSNDNFKTEELFGICQDLDQVQKDYENLIVSKSSPPGVDRKQSLFENTNNDETETISEIDEEEFNEIVKKMKNNNNKFIKGRKKNVRWRTPLVDIQSIESKEERLENERMQNIQIFRPLPFASSGEKLNNSKKKSDENPFSRKLFFGSDKSENQNNQILQLLCDFNGGKVLKAERSKGETNSFENKKRKRGVNYEGIGERKNLKKRKME